MSMPERLSSREVQKFKFCIFIFTPIWLRYEPQLYWGVWDKYKWFPNQFYSQRHVGMGRLKIESVSMKIYVLGEIDINYDLVLEDIKRTMSEGSKSAYMK